MSKSFTRIGNLFGITCLLSCVGCCIHQPLMVKDQAKLIGARDKQIKNFAEPVQTQIASSTQNMALVVFPSSLSGKPAVYPTVSAMSAAMDHVQDVSAGESCFLVFKRTLPVPPERMNCSVLAHDAQLLLQLQSDLQKTRHDLDEMGKIVGPTVAMVELHEKQLQAIEKSVDTLVAGYAKAADSITTNNKELERLIQDSDREFADIRTILQQIQSRRR